MHKLKIIIFLFAVMVLFIGALTTFLPKNATENNIDKIDTKDWQTFTNTKYGYSIKYPSKYTVTTESKAKLTESDWVFIKSSIDLKFIEINVDKTKQATQSFADFVNTSIEKVNFANKDSTGYYPLQVTKKAMIGNKEVLHVSNNAPDKHLWLRSYINKSPTEVIWVRLGPVFPGAEKRYTTFFYQILDTMTFP